MDEEQSRDLEWAKAEVGRLRSMAAQAQDSSPLASAREFLRTRASGTRFVEHAERTDFPYYSEEFRSVAFVLEEWVRFTETGMASTKPYEQRFRLDAATDLMEQVGVLLADKQVHPAVPIMVGGAALEELLRSLHSGTDEPLTGNPSISKYGEALKRANVIDRHQAHQIDAMAATRNKAAHGEFEEISTPMAVVFVQQVNLFIAQHAAG